MILRVALIAVLGAGPTGVAAFPDGAPWNALHDPGCADCHFDGEVRSGAGVLQVEGLPDTVAPGGVYRLRIAFNDDNPDSRYGILLSFLAKRAEAGRIVAVGDGLESRGAQARSATGLGAAPPRWEAVWQAPATLPSGDLRMVLWANEANGDGSPFGDRVYRLDQTLRLRDTANDR